MANIKIKKPKFTQEINAEIIEKLNSTRSHSITTGAILTALGAQIGVLVYIDQTLPDMQRYQYVNIEDCACDYPRQQCKIEVIKDDYSSQSSTFGPWFDAHDRQATKTADGALCAPNAGNSTDHRVYGSFGGSSNYYPTSSKRLTHTQKRGGFGRTASRGFSSMG